MPKELPSPELLRKLLRYELDTGKLFWLERPSDMFTAERHYKAWNARYAGKEAFTTLVKGYRAGSINNRHVYAHRAAFCIVEGRWPENIDHINGGKSDNRWENLREVSHVLNMRNLPTFATNKSGITGVTFVKSRSVWRASIGVRGSSVFLGDYETKEKAIIARASAEKALEFDARALHSMEPDT